MDYLEIIKKMEHDPEPRTSQDWLAAWRKVAAETSGIESKDDPRYEKVMRWFDVATTAELMDCWPEFLEAAERLREIMGEPR